ncbi:CBS domain-containing protein, partial [bacterium]|nr:CBS domain-containing protein [bacterium]
DQLHVHDCATRPAVTVAADATVAHVRQWLESDARGTRHQAFPVLDRQERLVGVVTGREIREAPSTARRILDLVRREAIVIGEDNSLREAADVMAREDIGRLPVVAKGKPGILVGIITRSDLVGAHTRRLAEYRRTRLRPRR